MIKLHPCCGFSLRNGSIILAVLDIIGSIFGILSTVVTIVAVTGFKESIKGQKKKIQTPPAGLEKLLEEAGGFVIGMLIFVTFVCLIEFGLAVLLLRGSKERNTHHLTIWWRTKCVTFFLAASFVIFAMITSDDRLDFFVCGLFGMAYQIYSLWVVRAFITEIQFDSSCEQKGIQKL